MTRKYLQNDSIESIHRFIHYTQPITHARTRTCTSIDASVNLHYIRFKFNCMKDSKNTSQRFQIRPVHERGTPQFYPSTIPIHTFLIIHFFRQRSYLLFNYECFQFTFRYSIFYLCLNTAHNLYSLSEGKHISYEVVCFCFQTSECVPHLVR